MQKPKCSLNKDRERERDCIKFKIKTLKGSIKQAKKKTVDKISRKQHSNAINEIETNHVAPVNSQLTIHWTTNVQFN